MDRITENTHIEELLAENPGFSQIFIQYGLPCLVCGEPFWGTIRELANQHSVDAKGLVKKLNEKRLEINAKS
jgi:hypothetical protein